MCPVLEKPTVATSDKYRIQVCAGDSIPPKFQEASEISPTTSLAAIALFDHQGWNQSVLTTKNFEINKEGPTPVNSTSYNKSVLS